MCIRDRFRGAQSDESGSIIHDLQSAGVKFGRDLNGFTRTDDTFYYVNLPSEELAEIKSALRNISQLVKAPNLSTENLEAEKKIVLAELKLRDTLSMRAARDFRQFKFPDQKREKINGAGTEESLSAIELSDVQAFYETHYVPENALLVIAGDVKSPQMEKIIESLFSDWAVNCLLYTSPSPRDRG